MFATLKEKLLKRKSEAEQSAASAYKALVSQAVSNDVADDAKSVQRVEEMLAKVGVSFAEFEADVERQRRRGELEAVASNQAAIEAEIREIKSEIRATTISRDKAVADFQSKLNSLESRKHALLAQLGETGRAVGALHCEFPHSPVAEASSAARDIEILQTRIVQLKAKLAEAVETVKSRKWSLEKTNGNGANVGLETRLEDDLARAGREAQMLTMEIERAESELESARERAAEFVSA